MYHLIEFCAPFVLDVEVSPQHRLQHVRVGKGARAYAQLAPQIVETAQGPIEVADLYFDDGPVARLVPYEQFRFVE